MRATRRSGHIADAVIVLAIMTNKNPADGSKSFDDGLTYPRVVIEKQYRPPVGKVCIEFPAGLIDEGETVEECAIRELKEETGYIGTICDDWFIPYSCNGKSLVPVYCFIIYSFFFHITFRVSDQRGKRPGINRCWNWGCDWQGDCGRNRYEQTRKPEPAN